MPSTRFKSTALLLLGATMFGLVLEAVVTAVPIFFVRRVSGQLACSASGAGYSFLSVFHGSHRTAEFVLCTWDGPLVQRTNAVAIRTAETPASVSPRWAEDLLLPSWASPRDSVQTFAIRLGWPLAAVQYTSTTLSTPPSSQGTSTWNLRVLPLGLLADVSIFAVPALCLRAFALSLRRRRRQACGRCERCGYPLVSATVCPECGSTSSVRTRKSAALVGVTSASTNRSC